MNSDPSSAAPSKAPNVTASAALPQIDPGVTTSEFWLALIALVLVAELLVHGLISGNVAALLFGAIFTGYPTLRTILKGWHLDAVSNVLISSHALSGDTAKLDAALVTIAKSLPPPAPLPVPTAGFVRGRILAVLVFASITMVLAPLVFSGCAHFKVTTTSGSGAKLRTTEVAIQSNVSTLNVSAPDGTKIKATGIDNATATDAGGRAFASGTNAVGGAGTSLVLGFGASGILKNAATSATKSLIAPTAAVATQAVSKPSTKATPPPATPAPVLNAKHP